MPNINSNKRTEATVTLRELVLHTSIGTYGPNDVVPDQHLLNLSLLIEPSLVLIPNDGMEYVFDYDPLIATIDKIARDRHYTTQEYLLTRIVHACAQQREIQALEIEIYKTPVLNQSGRLGIKTFIDHATLIDYRTRSIP